MNMKISVLKLDKPEYYGDWHDKPLKWKVVGPGNEIQKFETRKHAELYKKLRKKFPQGQAQAMYCIEF